MRHSVLLCQDGVPLTALMDASIFPEQGIQLKKTALWVFRKLVLLGTILSLCDGLLLPFVGRYLLDPPLELNVMLAAIYALILPWALPFLLAY
eukprot:5199022-Amphidinium_carterae.1